MLRDFGQIGCSNLNYMKNYDDRIQKARAGFFSTRRERERLYYCIRIDGNNSRAEEFGQNYVRSAATSVDKSENSPQFSYIILR